MCFSPEASFLASGGLGAAGAVSLAISNGKQRALAAIPIAFALQQAFEGYQWLCLRAGSVCPVAGYGFLIFALIIWPCAIPFIAYSIDEKRRPLIRWFVFLGISISLYFLAMLVLKGASASIYYHSIQYEFTSFIAHPSAVILYIVAVCVPLAVSSIAFLRWFALVIFSSAVFTYLFYTTAFVSVWCFFAAVLSILIAGYIVWERLKAKETALSRQCAS